MNGTDPRDFALHPSIATVSGHYFDLVETDVRQVKLRDIARGLANTARFNGQTRSFYSVAQHSVLCARHAPLSIRWEALMHDAHEAYVGDMPSPLKAILPDYEAIEESVCRVVRTALGIEKRFLTRYAFVRGDAPGSDESRTVGQVVKMLDNRALATEKRDLVHDRIGPWRHILNVQPFDEPIVPLEPDAAYKEFLDWALTLAPDTCRAR